MYAIARKIVNLRGPDIPVLSRRLPRRRSALCNSCRYISLTRETPFEGNKPGKSKSPHNSGEYISVIDPSSKKLKLSQIWLRDHCQCRSCVNPDTLQKAFDTFSVTCDATNHSTSTDGLTVQWRDGHVSNYSWDWLTKPATRWPEIKRRLWDSEIKTQPPSVHYDEILASDQGVATWTSKIQEYGFCFVDACPVSPEATEKLLERIAFIRVTHYGGFYDFTSDLTMKDTAYTSLALPAHTDNTYFTEPSGLQAFHLLSHTSGEGGASLLVDGFHCAQTMQQSHPEAHSILRSTPIGWHASGNEGITITPAIKFPVLDYMGTENLMQVRWNNDDRASILGFDPSSWYEAAGIWNSIVKDQRNEYWEQLKPGRPLIFDNWRVMHGRSAFTGKRRMCGGYINHDDFISRYWNTNYPRERVLKMFL